MAGMENSEELFPGLREWYEEHQQSTESKQTDFDKRFGDGQGGINPDYISDPDVIGSSEAIKAEKLLLASLAAHVTQQLELRQNPPGQS